MQGLAVGGYHSGHRTVFCGSVCGGVKRGTSLPLRTVELLFQPEDVAMELVLSHSLHWNVLSWGLKWIRSKNFLVSSPNWSGLRRIFTLPPPPHSEGAAEAPVLILRHNNKFPDTLKDMNLNSNIYQVLPLTPCANKYIYWHHTTCPSPNHTPLLYSLSALINGLISPPPHHVNSYLICPWKNPITWPRVMCSEMSCLLFLCLLYLAV